MLPEVGCYDLQASLFFSPYMAIVAQLLAILCDLSPSLKSKLSCQRAVDLTYQFSSGQESSSIKLDLLLNICGQEPKHHHPLKVNCEVLSFLSTNCSAPLSPQGHLTSKFSSSREMKFYFPVQELLLWKTRVTLFLSKRSTKGLYHQQPRITEVCGRLLILHSR